MFRCLVLAVATAAAFTAMPVQARSVDTTKTLNQLFADEWERGLVESPENASYEGDTRFNDRWSDRSVAAIERQQAGDKTALARLHSIDRATLALADQLNYDTFEWNLQHAIERQKFKEYLQPVSHQGGVQTIDGITEVMPFASSKDYRDWLKRMEAVPTVVEQAIALMREGVKAGNVPPKILMQRVPGQIAAQIVEQWIYFDERNVESGVVVAMLQFVDGARLIA